MAFLLFPIALLLPTAIGWLLLRVVEGTSSVLQPIERVIAGFCIGSAFVPFAFFLTTLIGIGNFSFVSMLAVQLILVGLLGGVYLKNRKAYTRAPALHPNASWVLWQKVTATIFALWFAIKAVSAWLLLIGPGFLDDTLKNWNLRGKMFYETKDFVLELADGKALEVSSYPPTVPLMKTWVASVHGSWHEGLVNTIHLLWFFAALVLMYFVLRRLMASTWALIGTYILSSLPLYLVHGGAAYADQFLSLLIFIAVAWLYLGLKEAGATRASFLRISALSTGLLLFTKNEALLLYIPVMGLIIGALLITRYLSIKEKVATALWYGECVLATGIPWLLFKWSNSLTFGNAKSATGMLQLEWHEDVIATIWNNTFFMGHWLLLPVLFVALLIVRRGLAFRSPLIVCTAFFLVAWCIQLFLYVFTELHVEAIMQTGYTRGVLHLVPLVVLITTVCLERVWKKV